MLQQQKDYKEGNLQVFTLEEVLADLGIGHRSEIYKD
jgi:hypothetical protein